MKRLTYSLLWICTIAIFFVPACMSTNEEKIQSPEADALSFNQSEPLQPPAACEAIDLCVKAKASKIMCDESPQISQDNTEEYKKIEENSFKSSKSNPLSTFSIDVDGASYSNVRKKLMDGVLPDADAVRVEEFVNYFNYSYPSPTGENPFAIYTEYANCPWNKNHTLLQIGLKAKQIDANNAVANNLVFLIDVSGSMDQPDKLPLLKRAFKLLIPQLRSQDKLTMVVYAGSAGVVLNGVNGNQKAKMMDALDKLDAGGSTAGGEGINLAYNLAKEHFIKNGNNRIILATDGDFNVGVSSDDELEKLIVSKRDQGIYLSVLGFGEGNIKDNKMETLADKGNGNYNFIDNILEARKVLITQFGGTITTIAKDVKIQIEFNPAKVKEYRLIGYENRMLNAEDFNDDKKDAGELGSGHCVTALYEIIPAGSEESKTKVDDLKYTGNSTSTSYLDLATVKFRYKGIHKEDTTSKLISKVVYPITRAEDKISENMKLASAAAEFGMLLRDSKEKGNASYSSAISLATQAKTTDEDGYVSGLIDMMKIAKDLQLISYIGKE